MPDSHAGDILIPARSIWKFDKGVPEVTSNAWSRIDFDDSAWPSGPAGFGYGDDDDLTELTDMQGNYRGIRIRHVFTIEHPERVDELHLHVRYDDGFIGYINGREVVRAHAADVAGHWTADDHEADEFEHFTIQLRKGQLRTGNNVIAIAGVNRSLDSSDFSLDPVLATSKLDHPGIPPQLSRAQLLADLDTFESRLEDQSSYLTLTGFDYRQEIAALRDNAGPTLSTDAFARQLSRVIARLGDAHADVSLETLKANTRYLPFVLADSDAGVIAIDDESNRLLDADHPFVIGLDGVALDDWLAAADQHVSQASLQLRRRRGLRELRRVSILRSELDLPPSQQISVTLQSADAKEQVTRTFSLSTERLRSGKVPLGDSRLLDGNIGYLRIDAMKNSRVDDRLNELEGFLDTDGLIIDVRDNSGGRYGMLEAIHGYFLPENAAPYVSNIAAYRRSQQFDDDHLHYRPTYRLNHPDWNAEQRAAILTALQRFEPQWRFPDNLFSDWHFMLLEKQPRNERIHYDRPVVVLSNAGSFSATDGFLSAFADLPQVTLVGLPSAGGSGATKRFELPYSGIRIALSSMASYRPDGRLYDGHGIEVDIRVAPVISDYLGESDTALDKAIDVIIANR